MGILNKHILSGCGELAFPGHALQRSFPTLRFKLYTVTSCHRCEHPCFCQLFPCLTSNHLTALCKECHQSRSLINKAFRCLLVLFNTTFVWQVCWSAMERFTFFLRLGGKVVGRFSADLDISNTLACAKGRYVAQSVRSTDWACRFCIVTIFLGRVGSLTEAAERALGHKLVIKRFMVTVWGRTGYLLPEQEHAPLKGSFKFSCYLSPLWVWCHHHANAYSCCGMQTAQQL